MMVIGITNDINEDELRQISSEPKQINKTYFLTADFNTLSFVLEGIIHETCIASGKNYGIYMHNFICI